ncbi:hypothetical protein C3942_10865 [Solimonas fluminis]|uniref:Knr4/Smi1-like domain-containing protein n=1 Tax=Solimonas fluminis TaxID=2086571 RepID=A0A2S5TFW6_9GAMM|nr:hypothetical protein C3942_10865 [Solimonas fluminis]
MKISTEIPSALDISSAEKRLSFSFPEGYVSFLRSGGLGELRIKHRVLSPSEAIKSQRLISHRGLVPFADNGCGDFYCWVAAQGSASVVVFVDHESGTYHEISESFDAWLRESRF